MSNMNPREMTASLGPGDPNRNTMKTDPHGMMDSMNPKNLANRPRDQINEMKRESGSETLQGNFSSMDAWEQRDTIETLDEDQKKTEANQEGQRRRRGSHLDMSDIPEQMNTI